jgi:hypothetical protein
MHGLYKKRYNLILNKPLKVYIFINDSMRDLTHNGKKTEEEALSLWESVKENGMVNTSSIRFRTTN